MDVSKERKIVRVLNYVIAGTLLLLPFHALLTTWAGQNLGNLDLFRIWKEILLVPLALGALLLVLKDKKLQLKLKVNKTVQLIGLYILLHIIIGAYALITHKVNIEALAYALIINLRFLVFFLVCLIISSQNAWLKNNWQKIILWPAAVVVIFGLLQQFVLPVNFLSHFGYGHETIPAYHTIDQKLEYLRIQSTLRGPNPLGAYLILIIGSLIGLTVTLKNRKHLKWSMAIGGLIALYFSYSRSAWLGLVLTIATLIYLLIKNKKTKRLVIAAVSTTVAIVVATLLLVGGNNALSNTLLHTDKTSRSPDSSNEVRSQALTSGLKSVIKRPLGNGPGSAGPASFRNDKPPRLAENYYIQIAQEVGVIGAGLFIAINVLIVKALWQNRRHLLAAVLLASFLGLVMVNMLSHAWADDTLAYLWWGLAGIALSSGIIKQNAKIQTAQKAKT